MKELELRGIGGSNPLGMLAALGVLRMATEEKSLLNARLDSLPNEDLLAVYSARRKRVGTAGRERV